jgi:DNA-binding MarR family transcriptional regulator
MQEEDSIAPAPDPRRLRILLLLREMAEAMDGLQDDYARAVGLHVTDLDAVTHLHGGGEPLTMRELGQRLQLTAGAVTGLVDRLERSGHVTRVADAHDRRRTRLRLTPKAVTMTDRFFADLAARTLVVLDRFDDDGLAVIESFLEQLPAVLDPARRDQAGRPASEVRD